jgi:nitrogen fixation/metabolism regulation signal transduction histidine kinase
MHAKVIKRENIFLIIVIFVFSFYFATITFFIFSVDPISLFGSITRNRLLLLSLISLFLIMFVLVIYNILNIVMDRVKNREGSKFRLRLTLFFLLVTLIPIVPLSLISNNMLSKSINLWFVSEIEGSLLNGIEVSKELYNRLADESVRELDTRCKDCDIDAIGEMEFERIDGVVRIYDSGTIQSAMDMDYGLMGTIQELQVQGEMPEDSWKRLLNEDSEYLFFKVAVGAGYSDYLIRKIPDYIRSYTSTISNGLQSYRTLKIVREPLKGIVILFFVVITMPFVLLSFYLSLIISRQVTVPIRALAHATRHVAEDDLDYSIDVSAKDELKLLIDSFNSMTHDLKVNKELLKHSERSAAWRDIARRIAHEIKNPLTPIKLSAERLLKLYERDDQYREVLSKGIQTIISEVENLTDMVNEFSHFARFPDTKLGRHDIIAIIEDVLDFLKDSHRGVDFRFSHTQDQAYLLVDGTQIRRAILNIIYNSLNAIREKGVVTIHCEPGEETDSKNKKYTIAITDNGVGIDRDVQESIFDPYVSTNSAGSGLGLAIVEKIVLDNRGRVWFESEPGRTTFYMELQKA